jgi:hypothetical protein
MKKARAEAIIDGKFETASRTLKAEIQLFYDAEGFDGAGLTKLYPDIVNPDSHIGALRRAYWTSIVKTLSYPHAYPSRYMAMSQWQTDASGGLREGTIHIFKNLPLSAFIFISETENTDPQVKIDHPAIVLDAADRHKLGEVDSVIMSELLIEEELARGAYVYNVSPEVVFSDIPVGFARITTNERLHRKPEVLEMAMVVMGNRALRAWKDNEFFKERQLGHIE